MIKINKIKINITARVCPDLVIIDKLIKMYYNVYTSYYILRGQIWEQFKYVLVML